MRYHNITTDDMLNGDGLRVVLWTAGCSHACKGCHNPVTWDVNGGLEFDKQAEEELFQKLEKNYIAGITFSGGDPLHPENREEVGRLIEKVHDLFPMKTIWLYTGYMWEEIQALPYIGKVDVLVDGKFIEEQKDAKLQWRGSANQRVIEVKESLLQGEVVQRD